MYLTQGLHRAVQQMPDAPTTMFGERVRTWRQHADRVARLADALRGLGVADGSRVGILALNSDRYAELLLAVPWAGGVFTPVNTRWNPAELVYALRDSATTILCVGKSRSSLQDHMSFIMRPRCTIWSRDGVMLIGNKSAKCMWFITDSTARLSPWDDSMKFLKVSPLYRSKRTQSS